MSLITQTDLENRIGAAEVTRFSRSTASQITSAIAQAESKARSAALNVFTAASWDAMTSATLPAEALYHLVSDAVDVLSAGSGRPDEIQIKADEAKQWRSYLAGDKVRCFDAVLTKIASTTGGALARVGAPSSRVFDSDDSDGGLRARITYI